MRRRRRMVVKMLSPSQAWMVGVAILPAPSALLSFVVVPTITYLAPFTLRTLISVSCTPWATRGPGMLLLRL